MCGIAGFIRAGNGASFDWSRTVRAMALALEHRGPDDEGIWIDNEAGVALGHRRLSIVDLSVEGHQPMVSASGRYVIIYNGEIYNHQEIRRALADGSRNSGSGTSAEPGHSPNWRGHSDTETFLAAVEAWGVRGALQKSVGMFAIALWDRAERRLTLARDRLGEKPLYYGWWKNDFLFGSELKALRAFPGFSPEIDRAALVLYFSHKSVPAPRSIYRDIAKLPPGHLLSLDFGSGATPRALPRSEAYWSLEDALAAPRFSGTPDDAVDELEALLGEAVRLQMMADVPVGAFLSGGVDSSAVVALMQASSSRPVRTFSIGFSEARYNEAPYAAAVASHLGTEHTEMIVTPPEAMAVIPSLPDIWDEPFADSSQIPTAIVSALARRHVTVSLSGDAGDELFCGYSRYLSAQNLERIMGNPAIAGLGRLAPLRLLEAISRAIPHAPTRGLNMHRLRVLGDLVRARTPVERYLGRTYQPSLNLEVMHHDGVAPWDGVDLHVPEGIDYLTAISAIDAVSYLPNDILTKVDRAAMAVSLESRVPLLDHRVVEFAYSLPADYKLRNGQTKWPLRELLYRHVPRELIERPKKGFGVPIREWLRGPLREWAEELLPKAGSTSSVGLHTDNIARLWKEHLSGTHNWDIQLWPVLMFCAWEKRYG